ncbi:MAG TPA: ribose 5-phosphate isomerase B [Candidatus Kapabacteria bacterium]|nr:ribose 5-phosphate isomerase B [Candidatus Kapabacteria bacterium]
MPGPIALAADHGGLDYKNRIAAMLRDAGYDVTDFGTHTADSTDYPDHARDAAEAVSRGDAEFGIIVCGSGIGVSIVANKSHGVRAANCVTAEMAGLAREHNHANVLTIGERLMTWDTAREIVQRFLATPASSDERHRRRVRKIHDLTETQALMQDDAP